MIPDHREYDEPDHVCPEPEPYVDSGTKDVRDEIQAMASSYEALRSLSQDGQARAMRWLASKLGVNLEANTR